MIYHVAGLLGSGKTLYAVAKIIYSLIFTQKTIVTNIRLVDFWDRMLAEYVSKGLKHFLKFLLSPFPDMYNWQIFLARQYASRYIYFSDLEAAVDFAFASGESPESSKLFIWDEVHLDLNARQWKTTSLKMIKFFSMSRKLGFDVVIISQLRSAVDRQMRDLGEMAYTIKNMRNWKLFGIPLFPSVGLLTKRWANKGFDKGEGMFVGAGVVRYDAHIRNFYNTRQLLTEKLMEAPLLWSDIVKNDACASCAYMNYYLHYADFVFRFCPRSMAMDSIPGRLIYKNVGSPVSKPQKR